MQLHGSTEANLISAVRSADRLRGQEVHADTIKYWADLLHHARQELLRSIGPSATSLEQLVAELEIKMANRAR